MELFLKIPSNIVSNATSLKKSSLNVGILYSVDHVLRLYDSYENVQEV